MAFRTVVLILLWKLDATEESSTWEDEYLKDDGVWTLLGGRVDGS